MTCRTLARDQSCIVRLYVLSHVGVRGFFFDIVAFGLVAATSVVIEVFLPIFCEFFPPAGQNFLGGISQNFHKNSRFFPTELLRYSVFSFTVFRNPAHSMIYVTFVAFHPLECKGQAHALWSTKNDNFQPTSLVWPHLQPHVSTSPTSDPMIYFLVFRCFF